jgi:hypothetical protein
MADFSLTTLFVVPSTQTTFPSSGSTQDLTAGQVGVYGIASGVQYSALASGTIAASPYFYIAQGRTNTYLQGSKRSDKISGPSNTGGKNNVTEWYKVSGSSVARTQVTDVSGFNVKCGDVVSITLRAHSSYIDTLYFNGFTRSVTVQAPCCDCGSDPCTNVDVPSLIDKFILAFQTAALGSNPDNISFSKFFQFQRLGNDANAFLRISGKTLTKYGQTCDIAAFPYEYDRMYFRTFVYSGPATTADFLVSDNCNIVATSKVIQRASYVAGTADEIKQLEKNYYSYQAGYLKHLYRMAGYNANFESWVADGTTYDTYYIKFNEYDKSASTWGDYIDCDSQVIIAVPTGTASTNLSAILSAALGTVTDQSGTIISTSTTSTTIWPTTLTTSTLIP